LFLLIAERGRIFVTHREGCFYKIRHKRLAWAAVVVWLA